MSPSAPDIDLLISISAAACLNFMTKRNIAPSIHRKEKTDPSLILSISTLNHSPTHLSARAAERSTEEGPTERAEVKSKRG